MARSIMIQGTMSNAGKSVLAGGLCRVLKQDGTGDAGGGGRSGAGRVYEPDPAQAHQ